MEKVTLLIVSGLSEKNEILSKKVDEIQKQYLERESSEMISKVKSKNIPLASTLLPYVTESIKESSTVFFKYIKWLKNLCREMEIPDSYVDISLDSLQTAFKNEFPEDQINELNKIISKGKEKLKDVIDDPRSYIKFTDPNGELALNYTNALLDGDRRAASVLIMDAVKQGIPISDIYLNVFQKSQYEVGRLWMTNKITVAKEHFCTAATQQIMGQLYPYIFSTERNGYKLVAANIGGELHEIGIRMVADFFEMDGWDTYYLGANTPIESIVSAINDNDADVVGLSIAVTFQVGFLKNIVNQIRNNIDKNVKIIIGGLALQKVGKKWKDFNADGYAPDAQEAVDLANRLVSS